MIRASSSRLIVAWDFLPKIFFVLSSSNPSLRAYHVVGSRSGSDLACPQPCRHGAVGTRRPLADELPFLRPERRRRDALARAPRRGAGLLDRRGRGRARCAERHPRLPRSRLERRQHRAQPLPICAARRGAAWRRQSPDRTRGRGRTAPVPCNRRDGTVLFRRRCCGAASPPRTKHGAGVMR